MPVITITSVADSRLAIYRSLPKSTFAQESGLFITEGDKVTERMFSSRYAAHSLLLEEAFVPRFAPLVPADLPIYVVAREIMLQTVGFPFHRGVMGCGRRVALPLADEVIPAPPQPCLVAICPQTQDPTNLGTIIRTALALGVDAMLLGDTCADPLSRRVIRVSMGAALRLPIGRLAGDLAEELRLLSCQSHLELVATVLDSTAEPLLGAHRVARMGLLFGSEGHGLTVEAVASCQRKITIPMPPNTDSLNAAVAAGIFLHYFSQSASIIPASRNPLGG